MAYVPDPTDVTQPTDAILAETAQAEFRALKAYIAGLVGLPAGGGILNGFRNRIINGGMVIDQANAGAIVSVNAAAVFFGPDQFFAQGTGAAGVFSMQQLAATPPSGFKNYLSFQTTTADAAPAAGSTYAVSSRIEGLNVIDFALGTAGAITFNTSMQMRSSLTGQFSGSFSNNAGNRSYPWTCNIVAANTWTAVQVTVAGDQAGTWVIDTNTGLQFNLDLGCGANARGPAGVWAAAGYLGVTGAVRLISTLNATLDITGVQVEASAAATSFQIRSFKDELALCQRYFEKSFALTVKPAQNLGANTGEWQWTAVGAAAAASYGMIGFKVSKRASPTMTGFSPAAASAEAHDLVAGAACSNTTFTNGQGLWGVRASCLTNAATAAINLLGLHWTASARL